MPRELVVLAPSFPTRAKAVDGQSRYVVESTHAIADELDRPIRALAFRLRGEPAREQEGLVDITRIDPPQEIATPFDFYLPKHYRQLFRGFASAACAWIPRGADVWLHGYELGPTARVLRRQDHRTVGVLHYSLAQETLAYFASAREPIRRESMSTLLRAMGSVGPLHRAYLNISRSIGLSSRMWPGFIGHQLLKLSHEKSLVTCVNTVVGVSGPFTETLKALYPGQQMWASAPGGSHPRPSNDVRAPSDTIELLCVGRPAPQKGWDYLVTALESLERDHPLLCERLTLRLIGAGPEARGPDAHSVFAREVMDRFERLARVRVDDLGRLDREAVAKAYDRADVLVHPSDYEPFGLVLVEAMSAGVAVLASDTDGPREIVDSTSGWTVPFRARPARPYELAKALLQLDAVPAAQWGALRVSARRRALEFSWRNTATRLIQAMDAAVGVSDPDARSEVAKARVHSESAPK